MLCEQERRHQVIPQQPTVTWIRTAWEKVHNISRGPSNISIMPEPRGLLKNNDRARSARSLLLRRPRGEGIIRYNAPFHCFRTNKLTNNCKIFLASSLKTILIAQGFCKHADARMKLDKYVCQKVQQLFLPESSLCGFFKMNNSTERLFEVVIDDLDKVLSQAVDKDEREEAFSNYGLDEILSESLDMFEEVNLKAKVFCILLYRWVIIS